MAQGNGIQERLRHEVGPHGQKSERGRWWRRRGKGVGWEASQMHFVALAALVSFEKVSRTKDAPSAYRQHSWGLAETLLALLNSI
mmetsp:Transcript_49453/g.130261  ORF Transcript_49453/g.130261 Transcript_49453/m.130261 type:complete len:85 (-) Transcript_49453:53-307(-)